VALVVIASISMGAAGWEQVGRACAMLVIATPGFLLWEFARRVSFAHLQLGSATVIDGAVAALQLAGLGVLAAMGKLSAGSALLTMAAAYYAVGAVWLSFFLGQVEFAPRRVLRYWRRNWRFGRWLVGGQVVGALHGLVPQWILGLFAGAAMAGTFSAFLNLALLANPAILAVANLLTPTTAQMLASGGRKELNRLLSRAALSMAGAMLIVAAVLAIGGEPLMILVYGAKFAGDRIAIALLGLCPLVWAVTTVFACGLTALRQNEVNFRAAAIGALVTAVIIAAFIQYGVTAGAAGLLSGSTVAMLIRAWAIYDRPPVRTNTSNDFLR
jgi:O-antigen/teichoic acid export membrane protein